MALISIGRAILRPNGLSASELEATSETRVPGKATFAGMDYQLTGQGERLISFRACTVPQVFDGMDAVALLLANHSGQRVVNYFRMGPNYFGSLVGPVVIRSTGISEASLHPFTGIGRVVDCSLELVLV